MVQGSNEGQREARARAELETGAHAWNHQPVDRLGGLGRVSRNVEERNMPEPATKTRPRPHMSASRP